jgi:phosphotransferase system enzyme I (PtsI)
MDRRRVKIPKRELDEDDIPREENRFQRALASTHQQFEQLKGKVPSSVEEPGDILEAHQLMLSDDLLVKGTIRRIKEENINAEWALRRTLSHIKKVLDHVDDEYFRQRKSDVEFVGEHIMRFLVGEADMAERPPADAVVVAQDLSPADAVQAHRAAVAALVTEAGGLTSHTALVARAFEIPAVVGVEDGWSLVRAGDLVIVDGKAGTVIVNPAPETITAYRLKARRLAALEQELLRDRDQPAETTDGVRLQLLANVELPDEIPSALGYGAEGIGLYRTEYFYLGRDRLPTEEQLTEDFKTVLRLMAGRPVVFRTFDMGGDKAGQFFKVRAEANPALGLRSTRLALKERKAFKVHLRALLRSVEGGHLRLMFPMISDVSELREVKAVLAQVREELLREGERIPNRLSVGIMIEMPSACMVARQLAKECDFFSIGSNDLIQYALAIDRVNRHVAYLYHPLHPAILRFIKRVVDEAHEEGIKVSICGAMSGEPLFTVVLLGLGLDELSMPALAIPLVKRVITRTSSEEAREFTAELLELSTVEEIEKKVIRFMKEHFKDEAFDPNMPDLFPWRKPEA